MSQSIIEFRKQKRLQCRTLRRQPRSIQLLILSLDPLIPSLELRILCLDRHIHHLEMGDLYLKRRDDCPCIFFLMFDVEMFGMVQLLEQLANLVLREDLLFSLCHDAKLVK